MLFAQDAHATTNRTAANCLRRAQVSASTEKAGHKWCALARDNWSCHGPAYTRMLKKTKAFDPHLVRGERIWPMGMSQ